MENSEVAELAQQIIELDNTIHRLRRTTDDLMNQLKADAHALDTDSMMDALFLGAHELRSLIFKIERALDGSGPDVREKLARAFRDGAHVSHLCQEMTGLMTNTSSENQEM
ncbi:hypothetical protein ABFS82_11G057900 [Erythranthe guttata]|uniref:uncharacterized protein LOC105965374 n=1 Tax=Erythranthe guttata TaxID=4155 RepID=UPI00064E0E90|nr:PREDICTED: uncharacterized protein LOC105965374 [Erythranthe guttata]|eukprot:XP_012845371.1 PREDICTED: uncharacterized protein LOC105965374 [Erythranthe guttata]